MVSHPLHGKRPQNLALTQVFTAYRVIFRRMWQKKSGCTPPIPCHFRCKFHFFAFNPAFSGYPPCAIPRNFARRGAAVLGAKAVEINMGPRSRTTLHPTPSKDDTDTGLVSFSVTSTDNGHCCSNLYNHLSPQVVLRTTRRR